MKVSIGIGVIVTLLGLWASPGLSQPQRMSQALYLYFNGDYRGAIPVLKEVIEYNPKDAQAYYYLAYSYYKIGELQRSREAFQEYYRLLGKFRPEGAFPERSEERVTP
jgi:predicted Zn-dependent protease